MDLNIYGISTKYFLTASLQDCISKQEHKLNGEELTTRLRNVWTVDVVIVVLLTLLGFIVCYIGVFLLFCTCRIFPSKPSAIKWCF